MHWVLTTLLSAFLFGIGGFLLKLGSHRNYTNVAMLFGLYLGGSLIFLCILLSNHGLTFNWFVLGFSILVGLGSYYANLFIVKAYDTGPASLTSPLMSLSILFVIALSALLYEEKMTSLRYLGIGFMVASVALLGCKFDSIIVKSRMWTSFVALGILFLFLREGGLKIAHENGMDNQNILFFAYVFSTILAGIAFLKHYRRRQDNHFTSTKTPQSLLLGSSVGLCSAVGMCCLAYAITQGPASIIVPIFSARNVITVLLIVYFFKEKLTRPQWASVGLLILAIPFVM